MADFLPEHKEGGDDGKLNVVPLKDESTRLQCAPSEVCEDSHQNKESTLLHSSKLQQDECASVNLHPVEARSAKSCEEAADNRGTLLGKDGSETAKACKKQGDKIGLGVDESKLTKASLSQAKDPPDKENSQAKGKLTVTEQNESSPLEGASNEILSVSTKSSEIPAPLNDNTSEDLPPCSLALPETQVGGNMLISQQNESSPLEGASNEILSVSTKSSETSAGVNNTTTEDPPTCAPALPVFEKSSSPTETGASIVGCQESLANSSKPTSLSTENSLVEDLDSSRIVSNDTHQEKLTEALAESQGSSKSSMSFASLETAGIEGSSTQSSSMSSASDLCPENDVELNVVDASSHLSPLASVPKLSSTPIQTTSAQQGFGNKMELSLNQSQVKEIEPHSQTSKVQCLQEYISAENKSQDKVSSEKDGAVIEGDKSYTESEVQGDSGNLTVEIEIEAEQNQSWNDMSLTNEADTESLPMIVATRSLSQEEDAEKEFTGKEEQTPTVYTEMEATNMKIVLPLESEPLKPVTIGSSLQPLEEIQETPVVEETSFTTDMAIIDSSADEADSIGGLVINNVIGAADGVVDFQPDEVETEKELTDISASAPQLGEGSDSNDEHGPSAKRRRLENGPNSVENKSKSAKKVIFKVIPVKNGHGVWDSQKLQEVLLTKGTILLQIHASDESMELFEPDKTDKTIDFTAIMAETKDDDHDHLLSFGNIDPDYHDPLSEGSSHPSYGRPFSHSHGRSTALQPAMSRPGFKHLQTPQQYHMKNELLGIPPPLEFEEPQMGSSDWSGLGLKRQSTKQQSSHLSYRSIPSQVQKVKQSGYSVKVSKVCNVCGVTLNNAADIAKHQQCVLLKCGKCQFQAKTTEIFHEHMKLHKMNYVEQQCKLCHEVFSSPITHAVHKRKIHGLYECRHCHSEFPSKTDWSNHIKIYHKDGNIKNINPTQSSDNKLSSSYNSVPMIVSSPPAGLIISSSESINTICTVDMQSSSAVYNPPLYSHGNPIRTQSVTLVDEERIIFKDEPLETENVIPGTLLINVKPRRHKRMAMPPNLIGFPCKSCSAVFKTLTVLRNHVKQKHTARPKCPSCNLTRSSTRRVLQHQITAHKEKFRCRHYCLALFDTREELSAHHISVHNKDDTLMKCRYCRMNYRRGTYEEHIQNCPGDIKCKRIKKCNACDKRFVCPTEYSYHIKICGSFAAKNDSERESLVTNASAEKTPTKQDPEEQKSNIEEIGSDQVLENTLKGKSIEKSSGETAMLKSEVVNSNDHKSKRVKCRFCPKTFNCEDNGVDHMINQHQTIFSSVIEYNKVCDICGKLFISGLSLCKHLLKHHENDVMLHKLLPANLTMDDLRGKCWVCKTSGVSYNTFHSKARNSLIEELLSSKTCKNSAIHESPTFQCCLCEENFTDTQTFWSHIKIHLSKSPFVNMEKCKTFSCSRCPQKYSTKSQLLEHLALHLIHQNIDGEKPKSNNTFADPDDKMDEDISKEELRVRIKEELSDDTKLKTDESVGSMGTFKCLECKQLFNIENDAVNHLISSHRNVLQEMINIKSCHLCDKSFVKPLSLCSHILNHYIDLGMWEDLVPRNLLSKVDKKYCWICNTILRTKCSRHMNKRNNSIENSLSSRCEELEEDEEFQCPLCQFSCSNRYDHWKHIKLHLFPNKKNSIVRIDVDSEIEQSTISQDSENNKFNCLKCNKQFYDHVSFHKHIATHFLTPCKVKKRKIDEIVLDEPLTKKRKTMTLRSKSVKSGNGSVKCAFCLETFMHFEEAVSHVLSVHKFRLTHVKGKDLSCQMCGGIFKSEWWLCRHIVKHYSNLEMWDALVPRDLGNILNTSDQCWICKCVLNKNYAAHASKRNALIGVLLTENCKEKETMFGCSLCYQEFPTRTEYWQHMKTHMCKPSNKYTLQSEKKNGYECSDCCLQFASERKFYRHLATHFIECPDEEKERKGIVLKEHLNEDTIQIQENSEDEWLPPSIVKKKNAEFIEQEYDNESNNCVYVIEDTMNVVNESEAHLNV